VVFPFELLSFQCPPESELEIWTHGLGGPELVERIPTGELLMEDGSNTVNVAAGALGTAALEPEDELTALWQEVG
jgi:hypothetical protein